MNNIQLRNKNIFAIARSEATPQSCRSLKTGFFAFLGMTALCLALTFVLYSPAFALSGRDVYDKVDEVRKKALNRKTEATMILFDKGGGRRTRTLIEYSKKTGPEAYKVLVVFKTPPDLRDVGFLIHARTLADRDLWAYFPEMKRIRKIPTSSQDDSFFGSDFSYDDFSGPPELDDYKFKILGEETVKGVQTYVIEVTPKIRRKYTKYIAWVAKDLWIHVKIEYYQEDDIYRAGFFSEIKMIDGIPTPLRFEMEDRKKNHRTEFTIEKIRYNVELSDDLFTQRSLERAGK